MNPLCSPYQTMPVCGKGQHLTPLSRCGWNRVSVSFSVSIALQIERKCQGGSSAQADQILWGQPFDATGLDCSSWIGVTQRCLFSTRLPGSIAYYHPPHNREIRTFSFQFFNSCVDLHKRRTSSMICLKMWRGSSGQNVSKNDSESEGVWTCGIWDSQVTPLHRLLSVKWLVRVEWVALSVNLMMNENIQDEQERTKEY